MSKIVSFFSQITKPLDSIFEWSPVDRAMILMVFLIVLFILYAGFFSYFLIHPTAFLNATTIKLFLGFLVPFAVIAIVLMFVGKKYKQHNVINRWLTRIYVFYYVAVLSVLGYLSGLLFAPLGVVIIGAPILGFILLSRRLVYQALVFSIMLFIGLSYLSITKLIPYAPLFNTNMSSDYLNSSFFTLCIVYFSLPHFLMILFLSDLCIDRWRKREQIVYELSMTDALTGLKNRYAIHRTLEESLKAVEVVLPLSIVLVDIDFFKRVNDNYGHVVGDKVLQEAGQIFKSTLRRSDHIGRYGGEEFLMLLENTKELDAAMIAERCRKMLEQTSIRGDQNENIGLTASFGIYCAQDATEDIESIIKKADRNLYMAKQSGRNRIWYGSSLYIPTPESDAEVA